MSNSESTQRFQISSPDEIYLDGNSLGRLPMKTIARLETLVRDGWGTDLIAGWNRDWIHLPTKIGDQIGGVIGAATGQCVVADSTSVNLFKLATAALRHQASRKSIVTDAANFPSDLYVMQSAAEAAGGGYKINVVGQPDDVLPSTEQVIAAIDSDTALVTLSHVTFRSGGLYPMSEITSAAHEIGALVLWDLSHSVGAVPMQLDEWQVDLAVGCTYKHLCGGPGAPAFLYVRQSLQDKLCNAIQGWFSHTAPFKFEGSYAPASGIKRFLTGTPPVLSLAAIEAGVAEVADVGIDLLRQRSINLTERFIELFDDRLSKLRFSLRTPRQPEFRGSHISIGHPEARRITQALIEQHRVIPDFRAPDNLRLGFAPLYTTIDEVERAVNAIVETVVDKQYENVFAQDQPVT